jgi:hypothetical protein
MGTNFKGKVIGMSLKDRGAILPAGHFANWHFGIAKRVHISSSFYEAVTGWVQNSMMKSIICHILIMVGTCIDQKLLIMKA